MDYYSTSLEIIIPDFCQTKLYSLIISIDRRFWKLLIWNERTDCS